MMNHFHIMRTKKHKMLSIVVLNMAKYTIISLILTDFVPKFFIFNLFWKNFRGSFRFKKVPSPKLILRGGGSTHFKKIPTPLGGGVHVHFGLIPKFGCFFDWKASLRGITCYILILNNLISNIRNPLYIFS